MEAALEEQELEDEDDEALLFALLREAQLVGTPQCFMSRLLQCIGAVMRCLRPASAPSLRELLG